MVHCNRDDFCRGVKGLRPEGEALRMVLQYPLRSDLSELVESNDMQRSITVPDNQDLCLSMSMAPCKSVVEMAFIAHTETATSGPKAGAV